jgi:hypothetical protein
MDNRRTIPGYKYYVDASTGARPDAFVVFLNIVPDPRRRVNGVLLEVTPERLWRLDGRERNYARVDIGAHLSHPVPGQAWAYAGTDAAVGRFRAGLREGRALISRDYYQGVLDDFARLGPGARAQFVALTDPAPCPLAVLRRVDVACG